jgi:hypothetical protein
VVRAPAGVPPLLPCVVPDPVSVSSLPSRRSALFRASAPVVCLCVLAEVECAPVWQQQQQQQQPEPQQEQQQAVSTVKQEQSLPVTAPVLIDSPSLVEQQSRAQVRLVCALVVL